jgi:glycosyltransferase involved in cell wall biosynthesis
MKIVQFSLDFSPFWYRGGPPRIMNSYAEALSSESVETFVFCSGHGENSPVYVGEFNSDKVYYFKSYNIPFLKNIYMNLSPIAILKKFLSIYEKGIYIHLSQTRSIFNVMALFISFFFNVRIVFSPFGSLPNRGKLSLKVFDFLITKPLVKRSEFNLGQTKNELNTLLRFGASNQSLVLAPLCLNSPNLTNVEGESRKIRQSLGVTEDEKLLLFLGRFHQSKGIDYLLNELLSGIKELHFKLVLVGVDNGMLRYIKKFIKNNNLVGHVIICEPVYGNDRFNWYRAADAYVITPSIYEETPLAAIEALSVGTPVITNFRADVPYLEEYNAGIVLQNGQSMIVRLMGLFQIDDQTKVRINARELYEKVYEVGNNVKSLISVLKK